MGYAVFLSTTIPANFVGTCSYLNSEFRAWSGKGPKKNGDT
jgi:hypothetical protein